MGKSGARPASGSQRAARRHSAAEATLGTLPEWNLADLYPGMDAPELERDVQRAADESIAFEKAWKGKLAAEARKGAKGRLGKALREYEKLEELIGRIMSYAGLIYAGDTSDPKRAKLYGDLQEKMTDASAHRSEEHTSALQSRENLV